MNEILLNVESKQTRCAYLKNGVLSDLVIERKKERQLTGNIYRGRVTNILHNIQSAFIDIDEGDNGFIHISDILENTKRYEEVYEMDFDIDETASKAAAKEASRKKQVDIDQVLKIDQPVIVQVVKESIGTKGARLTSNISIAGRYLVLLPNSGLRGVSRKIEDRAARERLRKIIRTFEMPQEMGLICRTAASLATEDMLIDEARELLNGWHDVMERFKQASGPALLYEESDLIKRSMMTAIDEQYTRILVDDYSTFQRCKNVFTRYKTDYPLRIEYYRDKAPMFERFGVEREIDKALRRKFWLPTGGYLYFDKTEAMLTIDVNSGRSTTKEGDVEEALVRINIEAAKEIARQLRIRNVGGLIIIDFIDMRQRKNQRRVLEKLREFMKGDKAKCTILGMSEFGLVEMTRQRSRGSLSQLLLTECPYCSGSGTIRNHESMTIEIERSIKKAIGIQQNFGLRLVTHPELDRYIGEIDKNYLKQMAEQMHAQLEFGADDTLHWNDFNLYSSINGEPIER